MARARDKTPIKRRTPVKPIGRRATKVVRVIQVLPVKWESGQVTGDFYYKVRAGSAGGDMLYFSQVYASKQVARNAAVREHEGRSNFEYMLEWTDGRTGKQIRETL